MGNFTIMLVLLRTLGDVMLVHNLVDGIFKKYGKDETVEVHVYTNAQYEDLLTGNPKIHKIHTHENWLTNWDQLLKESFTYDEVMIPQQLCREDNMWHQMDHLRNQHLVDFYLERCRLPKRDETERLKFFGEEGIEVVDENYIVVHTTTLVKSKNWYYMCNLIERLIDKGYIVYQIGAVTDISPMKVSIPENYKDVRGTLSFKQIAGLCKNAKAFIGLDSGISYIAAASGCKSIIIQGPTVPTTSGPWGDEVYSILSPTPDACAQKRCHGNCRYEKKMPQGSCINLIAIDSVINIFEEIT